MAATIGILLLCSLELDICLGANTGGRRPKTVAGRSLYVSRIRDNFPVGSDGEGFSLPTVGWVQEARVACS